MGCHRADRKRTRAGGVDRSLIAPSDEFDQLIRGKQGAIAAGCPFIR